MGKFSIDSGPGRHFAIDNGFALDILAFNILKKKKGENMLE